MARLIRSAHRTLVSSAFYRSQFHGVPSHNGSPLIQSRVATSSSLIHFRPYTAKSTDEDDILTILDSKISRLHSPEELVPVETFDSFKVEYELEKNVVVLNKRFGNSEHIRIEFDNHNMTVDVSKEDGGSDALRFTHRWFPWDDNLDDQPLRFELANELSRDKLASSHNRHDIHEYDFIQLLLIRCDDAFMEFLNERGINRKLCNYLNQYWERRRKIFKDTEQYKCLQIVRSFIEKN